MTAPFGRTLIAAAGLVLAVAACGPADGCPAEASRAPAEPIHELIVLVTGSKYRWHLRYPGPDGELGTPDDPRAERNLHVPADCRVRLELRSEDYLYGLRLPHLEMEEIAVPDLEFALEFESGLPATYELRGHQFCGFTHPRLLGHLVVESQEGFAAWLAGRAAEK